jgi:WD40 repeat protein
MPVEPPTYLCALFGRVAVAATVLAGCALPAAWADDELKFTVGHHINGASLSPNGKTLAVGGDNVITTWDLATGKRKTTLEGHKVEVTSVAFSTDGNMILAGARGPQVKLWRLSTGSEKFVTDEHDKPVLALAVCPDEKLMASAGYDKTIRLFDYAGKEQAVLKGHDDAIQGIAFMPNASALRTNTTAELRTAGKGKSKMPAKDSYTRLASVSDDRTARIWDLEKRELLATLKGHEKGVRCLAPSPDGSVLATGSWDETIRLWDTSLEKEAIVLNGRRAGPVNSLAFSPDGRLLAASEWGRSRCVRLWDTKTNKEIGLIRGIGDDFRVVLFTPDGKRLIGCVWDGNVRVWQVDKVVASEKQ